MIRGGASGQYEARCHLRLRRRRAGLEPGRPRAASSSPQTPRSLCCEKAPTVKEAGRWCGWLKRRGAKRRGGGGDRGEERKTAQRQVGASVAADRCTRGQERPTRRERRPRPHAPLLHRRACGATTSAGGGGRTSPPAGRQGRGVSLARKNSCATAGESTARGPAPDRQGGQLAGRNGGEATERERGGGEGGATPSGR